MSSLLKSRGLGGLFDVAVLAVTDVINISTLNMSVDEGSEEVDFIPLLTNDRDGKAATTTSLTSRSSNSLGSAISGTERYLSAFEQRLLEALIRSGQSPTEIMNTLVARVNDLLENAAKHIRTHSATIQISLLPERDIITQRYGLRSAAGLVILFGSDMSLPTNTTLAIYADEQCTSLVAQYSPDGLSGPFRFPPLAIALNEVWIRIARTAQGSPANVKLRVIPVAPSLGMALWMITFAQGVIASTSGTESSSEMLASLSDRICSSLLTRFHLVDMEPSPVKEVVLRQLASLLLHSQRLGTQTNGSKTEKLQVLRECRKFATEASSLFNREQGKALSAYSQLLMELQVIADELRPNSDKITGQFSLPKPLTPEQQREKAKADAERLAAEEEERKKPKEWGCEVCTYMNAPSARTCDMCGAPKPAGGGNKPTALSSDVSDDAARKEKEALWAKHHHDIALTTQVVRFLGSASSPQSLSKWPAVRTLAEAAWQELKLESLEKRLIVIKNLPTGPAALVSKQILAHLQAATSQLLFSPHVFIGKDPNIPEPPASKRDTISPEETREFRYQHDGDTHGLFYYLGLVAKESYAKGTPVKPENVRSITTAYRQRDKFSAAKVLVVDAERRKDVITKAIQANAEIRYDALVAQGTLPSATATLLKRAIGLSTGSNKVGASTPLFTKTASSLSTFKTPATRRGHNNPAEVGDDEDPTPGWEVDGDFLTTSSYFTNPATELPKLGGGSQPVPPIVKVTCSSVDSKSQKPHTLLSRQPTRVFTTNRSQSWICFELVDRHFIPSRYTLRSADGGNEYPRSWSFQGSTDGKTWVTLDEQHNNYELSSKHSSATFAIDPATLRQIAAQAGNPKIPYASLAQHTSAASEWISANPTQTFSTAPPSSSSSSSVSPTFSLSSPPLVNGIYTRKMVDLSLPAFSHFRILQHNTGTITMSGGAPQPAQNTNRDTLHTLSLGGFELYGTLKYVVPTQDHVTSPYFAVVEVLSGDAAKLRQLIQTLSTRDTSLRYALVSPTSSPSPSQPVGDTPATSTTSEVLTEGNAEESKVPEEKAAPSEDIVVVESVSSLESTPSVVSAPSNVSTENTPPVSISSDLSSLSASTTEGESSSNGGDQPSSEPKDKNTDEKQQSEGETEKDKEKDTNNDKDKNENKDQDQDKDKDQDQEVKNDVDNAATSSDEKPDSNRVLDPESFTSEALQKMSIAELIETACLTVEPAQRKALRDALLNPFSHISDDSSSNEKPRIADPLLQSVLVADDQGDFLKVAACNKNLTSVTERLMKPTSDDNPSTSSSSTSPSTSSSLSRVWPNVSTVLLPTTVKTCESMILPSGVASFASPADLLASMATSSLRWSGASKPTYVHAQLHSHVCDGCRGRDPTAMMRRDHVNDTDLCMGCFRKQPIASAWIKEVDARREAIICATASATNQLIMQDATGSSGVIDIRTVKPSADLMTELPPDIQTLIMHQYFAYRLTRPLPSKDLESLYPKVKLLDEDIVAKQETNSKVTSVEAKVDSSDVTDAEAKSVIVEAETDAKTSSVDIEDEQRILPTALLNAATVVVERFAAKQRLQAASSLSSSDSGALIPTHAVIEITSLYSLLEGYLMPDEVEDSEILEKALPFSRPLASNDDGEHVFDAVSIASWLYEELRDDQKTQSTEWMSPKRVSNRVLRWFEHNHLDADGLPKHPLSFSETLYSLTADSWIANVVNNNPSPSYAEIAATCRMKDSEFLSFLHTVGERSGETNLLALDPALVHLTSDDLTLLPSLRNGEINVVLATTPDVQSKEVQVHETLTCADPFTPLTSTNSITLRVPVTHPLATSNLRMRFQYLRKLNSMLCGILPFVDIRPAHLVGSLASCIRQARIYTFNSILAQFSETLLDLTATAPPNNKPPEVNVDRLSLGLRIQRGQPIDFWTHTGVAAACKTLLPLANNYLRPPRPAGAEPFLCFQVNFRNEHVMGEAGPYRQFFVDAANELVQPVYGCTLLQPTPNSRGQNVDPEQAIFIPRPSATSKRDLDLCEFVGVIFGCCMRTGVRFPVKMPAFLWKPLVGEPLTKADLREVDSAFVTQLDRLVTDSQSTETASVAGNPVSSSSLETVASNPESDPLFSGDRSPGDEEEGLSDHDSDDSRSTYIPTMTVTLSDGSVVDLVPNGHEIMVTDANRAEYVTLAFEARMREHEQHVQAIRRGMSKVIPLELLNIMSWRDLQRDVCGVNTIDLNLLRRHTIYSEGMEADSPVVQWLWEVLNEFDQATRRQFIKFCWAQESIPSDDAEFERSHTRLMIKLKKGPPTSLPGADTCFFNLAVPQYTSKTQLKERLLYALADGSGMNADDNTQHDSNNSGRRRFDEE